MASAWFGLQLLCTSLAITLLASERLSLRRFLSHGALTLDVSADSFECPAVSGSWT